MNTYLVIVKEEGGTAVYYNPRKKKDQNGTRLEVTMTTDRERKVNFTLFIEVKAVPVREPGWNMIHYQPNLWLGESISETQLASFLKELFTPYKKTGPQGLVYDSALQRKHRSRLPQNLRNLNAFSKDYNVYSPKLRDELVLSILELGKEKRFPTSEESAQATMNHELRKLARVMTGGFLG